MSRLGVTLQRAADWLRPQRDAVLGDWVRAVADVRGVAEADVRETCVRELDVLLERFSAGDVDGLLAEESRRAEREVRRGASLLGAALDIRVLDRCLASVLGRACPDRQALAETLVALDELGDRRLEALLAAQEDESARRLVEAQEQAARVAERAREVQRANEALRRAEAESRHRAEQIGLLSSVAHRIAAIREPEELMQQAADQIRARMNHTYVAVVVLDDEGVLVGRWAGRPGLGRTSAGRAQGPPGGIIGRALRLCAPQVVGDVARDPDYHPDVPGTRSEMVIPLLEGSEALGVLDFQSEQPFAFALDDVAAGETLAEFLVIALRNARLYQDARRNDHRPPAGR
jgi:putative methionine-R-sulfoxide reductase with GAF domain